VLAALGVQGRDFDVIDAVRCREVVPHVPAVLVRGNDHSGDRRLRVVVDQPRLVLRHVVRRRKRLYVQGRIRRIRYVNVYERRERFDVDAILWKRLSRIRTMQNSKRKRERINEKLTDKFVLWHVKYVSSAICVFFSDCEIFQAIWGTFVHSVVEWTRHVQVFGRGVAGVSVQLYVPARVLVVVDNVLITRD